MRVAIAFFCSLSLLGDGASAQGFSNLPASYVAVCKRTLDNAKATGGLTYELTKLGARAMVDEPSWRVNLDWQAKQTLAKSLSCVAAGIGGNINRPYVVIYSNRTNKMLASGTLANFAEK